MDLIYFVPKQIQKAGAVRYGASLRKTEEDVDYATQQTHTHQFCGNNPQRERLSALENVANIPQLLKVELSLLDSAAA